MTGVEFVVLTSVLDTVLGEYAMRPVTDTAYNLNRACSVSGNRIFGIRITRAVPSLRVFATNVTPGVPLRVTYVLFIACPDETNDKSYTYGQRLLREHIPAGAEGPATGISCTE